MYPCRVMMGGRTPSCIIIPCAYQMMHNNASNAFEVDLPRLSLQARIAVAGAGSIGCYVGGCLALAGRRVAVLLRPALAEEIGRHGMRLSDLQGGSRVLAAEILNLAADPAAAFAQADLILVTVKSGATQEMADLIERHAPPRATVVSLQNGIDNVDRLKAHLGDKHAVVGGMVPFNVVQTREVDGRPRFHRATSGKVLIGPGIAGLASLLDVPGLTVGAQANIRAVQWGKLLFNLNNALNALSGLPLATQLADRRWRRLLAAQIEEALAVLRANGIHPARIERVPPNLIPLILRLPDAVFRVAARRMLAIDPQARSSMWEDLERRRSTEIDHLQGAIVTLAAKVGLSVPVHARIVGLVRQAETAGKGSPHLTPEEVAGDGA
jgi:2-dehydropantoate 2-reductase